MPNPDTLLETKVLSFENSCFDVFEILSSSNGGKMWMDACNKCLNDWGKKVPNKFIFNINPLDMPPLYYIEQEGYYRQQELFSRSYDLFDLKSLPEKMVFGKFSPSLFGVSWTPLEDDKIGMVCNGGVITKNNQRWGYTAQESLDGIYLTAPSSGSLLGDMQYDDLSGDNKKYNGNDYNFPRTHFLEYVFARHCSQEEKNPLPAIRIELSPSNINDSTLQREKVYEINREQMNQKSHQDHFLNRF